MPRVNRSTLQERVYVMLKQSIMTGILVPGQPVSIKSLADALGTSPIPVREALRFLAAERAVVVMANGSVSVPTMTRARFEDLRRTRVLVEGFTTELAAKFISQKDIEKLEKLHLRIGELRQKEDARNFWDQSQKFKLIIYKSVHSETLEPIIESLWLQTRPYINLLSMSHPLVVTGVSYDLACINALKKGQGTEARHWTERDIMEVGEHILQLLPE
jgi:DNA-binding GntR family transcriptional regulator